MGRALNYVKFLLSRVGLLFLVIPLEDGNVRSQGSGRTIWAIGAHCGDMEAASGAVLAKQKKLGHRVVDSLP